MGIGINVNLRSEQFPKDIKEIATSLASEAGCEISRQDLIIRLYENLTKWYKDLVNYGFKPVRQAWLGLTPMIGKTVRIMFREEVIGGTAIGVDEDGSLILQTDMQKTLRVSAGDASVIKG